MEKIYYDEESYIIKYSIGTIVFLKIGTEPHQNVYHRVDGPAFIRWNGDKWWWLNAYKHRLNGPAIVLSNGKKFYFIYGKKMSYSKYKKTIKLLSFY